MGIGAIGENGVQEFFEELIYGYGYQEARDSMSAMTKDIGDSVLQDATYSAMSIVAMGAMMKLVQAMEEWIKRIFDIAKALILLLIGSSFVQNGLSRFGNLKGVKLVKKVMSFGQSLEARIGMANVVTGVVQNHLEGEKTTQNEMASVMSASNQVREHVVNKERFSMEFANNMAKKPMDSFLPKLLTGSFTAIDIPAIKAAFGRETATEMDLDLLNNVSQFLFVTDANGNVCGLTNTLASILNGLGYSHNKF